MAHDPRLVPTERVEHAPGVVHVGRDRVRPFRRRRREPSLLVPGDVVLLRELVGEIAEVVEAQPRPSVQQENRRPAAGAAAGDERSIVACREFRPGHGAVRSSHAASFAAMATRDAACHCGQLRLEVAGDPFAVSICNCLACQRRTGSAFGMQAGFKAEQVQVSGRFSDYARISDEADRKEHVFHFCPDCGSQVFYTEPTEPDLIVVSVGSFADPSFPPPTESGYDSRRHHWVGLPDSIQRYAPELWDSVRPLYEAGRYAEAADRGRELIEAHPEQGYLYYNVACCESLAGRAADAIEHLRHAIGMWEGCRGMAKEDSDFDPIRSEPAFEELVGG